VAEEIVVVLPEGAQCETAPAEEWELPDLKCIVPMLNEPAWHQVFGGHLAKVSVDGEGGTGYVTWWGNDRPSLRADIVEPEEK
jgi:hypothetical protein